MLEKFYRIDKAAGVSITTLPDGHVAIAACSIAVNNGKLDFGKKLTDLKNITDLNKYLPPTMPVALSLSGRGILQKQIDKVDDLDDTTLSSLLPNATRSDYYVQNFISGQKSFISLIRKSEADKAIQQLTDMGFQVLMLSIGPFPANNILSQLNIYDHELKFDGHRIMCNESSEWVSYKFDRSVKADYAVKLESEIISEKLIVPYAAAFQLLLSDNIDAVKADVPDLELMLAGKIEDKKLRVRGGFILAVFFVLLLGNFMLFSWLNTENIRLAGQVNQSAQSTNSLAELEKKVKEQEEQLHELGWDGGVNKSTLIDQLAATLPLNVTWTSVSVNPVDTKVSKEKRSVKFIDRTIQITGTTERIISLNEWLAAAKTKAWVKNIHLEKYTYNNELNTGQFSVIIKY